MKRSQDQPADAAELRRRAEEQLKHQRPEGGGQRTELETVRLVHELQVHQIELEMQNEELRQAHAKVETLLAQYADLYDFAPTGYTTLDREGAIRQVNLTGARLLGVERSRLVNRRFGLFVAEGDRRAFSDFLQKVFASQGKECCEVTLPQAGSQPLVARIEGTLSADGQECRAVVLDITERKRAEEALQKSEARLAGIIDSAMDGIVTIDDEERILVLNAAAEKMFGCPASEAIGQPVERFIPERFRAVHHQYIQRFGRMSATHLAMDRSRNIRGLRASGEEFPIEVSISRTEVNGHLLFTIILRDATERVRSAEAQEAEARVTTAMGQVGQTLMTELDSPDLMSSLCKVTADVLRCDLSHTLFWQEDEQVFRPIAGFGDTPEEQQSAQVIPLPRSLMQGVLSRLDQDDVMVVRSIPGDVLAMSQPLVSTQLCMALRHHGKLIGIQVAGRRDGSGPFDRTDQRIARDIAQLASLALSHVRVRKDLERASHLKSDFVATMSHELRSPLNIIMGYTDLVLEGEFGSLSLEATDALRQVVKSAQELLQLINATLDLGRLDKEQVPLNLQPICLADVLGEIAGALGQKPEVDLVWDVPPGLSLWTDPVKLKVILRNVIANAFKFTEKGTVTVTARARQAGVEITVLDTGVGIAPQVLPVIFEPFRQGDSSTTRRFGGVGLGLYIVHRLLDILAGTITVESEMGGGSTFRVWLPDERKKALG